MPQTDFVVESTIFLDSLTREGMNPDWIEHTVKPVIAELQSALAWFHAEAEQVRASQVYSPRGLQQKLRALADEATAKWPTTAEHLTVLRKRATAAQARATQSLTEDESIMKQLLTFLQEKEVRDILREKDPLELQVVYLEANTHGDELTIRALENAPAIAPLVDAATVAEARARRWRTANPEAATELHQLQRLVTVLDTLQNVATREMSRHAGLQPDEGNGVTMLE